MLIKLMYSTLIASHKQTTNNHTKELSTCKPQP